MKCPLTISARFYTGPGVEVVGGNCIKEECAWWYEGDQCCALTNLARDSTLILLELIAIKNKLPHWEQFSKR